MRYVCRALLIVYTVAVAPLLVLAIVVYVPIRVWDEHEDRRMDIERKTQRHPWARTHSRSERRAARRGLRAVRRNGDRLEDGD